MADIALATETPDTAAAGPRFFKEVAESHLEQGDLVGKTSGVAKHALLTYHRYHVEHPANEMFAVLTQSCDLVRRPACKARYISFAPVRSLKAVLGYEFSEFLLETPGGLYLLGSKETEGRYQEFLARLINNNEPRYFFIPARPDLGISEDMCVMLPLALPIKAEHYEECLEGRIAQLDDLFQAKLGWLLGQQYSRVGTPDWPEKALSDKVQSVSNRNLGWFPQSDFNQIRKLVQEFQDKNGPDLVLDEEAFLTLQKRVKNRKQLAIDMLFEILPTQIPPVGKDRFALRNHLANNTKFAEFFPNS